LDVYVKCLLKESVSVLVLIRITTACVVRKNADVNAKQKKM